VFRKTAEFVLALLCLISVYACGYRFAGSGTLPQGVQKVFIEVFENRTSQTGVERTMTNQLVFEFTRQREASLAGSAQEADAVLKGLITSIRTETISRVGTEIANEREVVMTVAVKLVKNDGAVIWAAKGIQDRETFGVTDSKLETDRNENEAIVRLSERMSERIFNRLTDDF
jgi:outer membrane lipopolysaccharide assembly protein LptE/RlpB